MLYVYLGSLANDLGELLSGREEVSPVVSITSAVLSGVFIVATFVMISVRAKRAISRYECTCISAYGVASLGSNFSLYVYWWGA